jgi:hypothetical protein
MAAQPDSSLAVATLPAPLYEALVHVYSQGIVNCMLVGGTALAGYYAGHRRSDDLDLFAADADAMKAAVLAVRSLRARGTELREVQSTQQFHSVVCELRDHRFTMQAVLDANLFRVGRGIEAADGVFVADLETLLKTKAATLLSRCSEKDLYDLQWLFGQFPDLRAEDLVALGAEIDGGMSAESLLINLAGTPLDLASCGFSLSQSAEQVFTELRSLKKRLLDAFDKVASRQPAPAVGELIRKLRG